MKLLHVVGARPNFPKLAPVYRAGAAANLEQVVVHTGQHYDDALSASFFRDLGIPKPDVNLDVGSSSHAVQMARIMERIEPELIQHAPDWVVVYGDVNSTAAAALVATKLGQRVAHVEAGLRSYDRTMPEEINRIVTDRLADLLLAPSMDALDTLRREGEPDEEVEFVGNVMIDSLMFALSSARETGYRASLGLESGEAIVVTLHRPSNVDDPARLASIMAALSAISEVRPVVFSVHPRTQQRLAAARLPTGKINILGPIRYLEMIDLIADAHAVITDSGGLQEETTALGIPCLTVRENTERPITITEGTNRLVPDPSRLRDAALGAFPAASKRRPEGWDGHAGERIIRAIVNRSERVIASATGQLSATS
jgi:UDP-N-acetylglucosamine 2-epimerase (non-hydrolysing)